MTTSTTALLPLDPALSPGQINRILPIRTNLLPAEIKAGRNARRTRVALAGVMVLVALLTGGWYVQADKQRDQVGEDLAEVTRQVDTVQGQTKKPEFTKVTSTITERDTITADLQSALKKDLPWQNLLDSLRTSAVAKGVTLASLDGTLDDDSQPGGAKTSDTVGTLTLSGTAKDKPTIAGFVDTVAKVKGVTDVYLTAANQEEQKGWSFTLNASIKSSLVHNRYGTETPTNGGK